MGTNVFAVADEDYIDMELTTDFEFFTFDDTQTSPSPADELFYKGKLLPLHLPPRTTAAADHYFLNCSTAPCTTANTPPDSCNISPSESCRPSCDLNPNDDFFEWPNELSSFIKNHHHHPKNPINSWPKKRSILAQKLRSSRAYLRSLFTKSICSHDSSASSLSKADASKYIKIGKKIADIIKNIDKNGADENGNRRSFSGAIKRHSPAKCLSSSSSNSSSSSSSFNSSGVRVNFLRRSSSSNEIEGSIDAAIAHCKKSMQTNSFSDSKVEQIGISVTRFES